MNENQENTPVEPTYEQPAAQPDYAVEQPLPPTPPAPDYSVGNTDMSGDDSNFVDHYVEEVPAAPKHASYDYGAPPVQEVESVPQPAVQPQEEVVAEVPAEKPEKKKSICEETEVEKEFYKDTGLDKHAFIASQLTGVNNIKVVKYRGKLTVKELCHKAFFVRICCWIKRLFVSDKPKKSS